jgi:two-component system sensor histidine kinase KdpD
MLGDARLAAQEGVDLVIGYLEPHGRPATEDRARDLERAPTIAYGTGGRAQTEPDVDWLLERRPSVAIIDELAHTNAAGTPRRKRYEDIEVLLDRGIDVWTTVNVQHLESLNERVAALTGVRVRETFPDRILERADEIRLVDLSPTALRERIAQGLVYPPERIDHALTGFFSAQNLTALRALVLHELAQIGRIDDTTAAALREAEALTESLGGQFLRRRADDAATAILHEARAQQITQIVLGKSYRSRLRTRLSGNLIDTIVRAAPGIDVHVVDAPRPRP